MLWKLCLSLSPFSKSKQLQGYHEAGGWQAHEIARPSASATTYYVDSHIIKGCSLITDTCALIDNHCLRRMGGLKDGTARRG